MSDVRGRFGAVILDPTHPRVISEMERVATQFDPNRYWAGKDGQPYRLSDRVWDAGQTQRENIDKILQQSMRTGEDALKTARKLENYLLPSQRPLRDINGRLRPGQPKRIVTATPGRGGRGSYAARRLTRTEIARVHSDATIEAGKLNPFAETTGYRTSPNHPEADECDAHASRDLGWGPGNYPPGDVPVPPIHPHCLCYLTINVSKNSAAVVDALKRKYDLADPSAADYVFPTDRAMMSVERSVNRAAAEVLKRGRIEANQLTRPLYQRAVSSEPAITRNLVQIGERTGARMEGLEFRLKEEGSTARKIFGDSVDNKTTVGDAATKIYDNVRYTYVSDASAYDATIIQTRIQLQEAGYTSIRKRNYWANDSGYSGYSGVNDVWQDLNGQFFEVQFHTPQSIYTKEKISHPLYEIQRKLPKGSAEFDAVGARIDAAWAELRAANPGLGSTIDRTTVELTERQAAAARSSANRAARLAQTETERAAALQASADRVAAERVSAELATAQAERAAAELAARRVDWAPSMTREEADIWRRGSAYRDDLFHGTDKYAAAAIEREGFQIGTKAWGRVWGDGVYATPERSLAKQYASGKSYGDPGAVVRVAVKIDRPLVLDINANYFRSSYSEIFDAIPDALKDDARALIARLDDATRIRTAEISKEQLRIRFDMQRIDNVAGGYDKHTPGDRAKWEALNKRRVELDREVAVLGTDAHKINALMDEFNFDGIIVNSTAPRTIDAIGGSQVVVRNPKQITVIRD